MEEYTDMLKRVLLGAAVIGFGFMITGCSEQPYFLAGDVVNLKEVTSFADIKGDPRGFEGKPVMVEGTVIQVCQGAGCWAKVVSGGSSDTMFVKSIGDKVLLPKTCAGDLIRVEGPVMVVEPEPAPEPGSAAESLAQAKASSGEDQVPCAGGSEDGCPQPDCFVSMLAVELFQQ